MSGRESSRFSVDLKRLREQLLPGLRELYSDRAEECANKVLSRIRSRFGTTFRRHGQGFDERDAILITYADQVAEPENRPLQALGRFFEDHRLSDCLSTVHLLPFFPYSSDDGFSVIDYRAVDPDLGTWEDIKALGTHFSIMCDLVLNHVSRESDWFAGFLKDDPTYRDYFIAIDPDTDVSTVTRPRKSPLLTPVQTARGVRYVWTTFSDDQIDLNYAEPDVLVEMLDVLFLYLCNGANVIRLDAIAYLWKEIGTPCIHLPQTHLIVKLVRVILDTIAPGTVLLTETNVPHEENVSYFGDGDEAGMVYQFSLAPLLLEAILSGDATYLNEWLGALPPPPPESTVLNFTASHDGIGVRPLEGLLPKQRFDRLIAAVRNRDGMVSSKANPDGTESPYELNITYFSALADPEHPSPGRQVARFLASQAIMTSLQGVPGVYFHSLTGTPNDTAGVEETGRARSINRRKYERGELDDILRDGESTQAAVFDGMCRILRIRRAQPAFHPYGAQKIVSLDNPALVAFVRTSPGGKQRILVLANLSDTAQTVAPAKYGGFEPTIDRLSAEEITSMEISLDAYQVRWLVLR